MAKPTSFPKQKQNNQPGDEYKMTPEPEIIRKNYKGSDKLKGKVALITGGDSGIGRSAAVHFAREGADVAIVYYDEHKDAEKTKKMIEKEGRKCLLVSGDIKDEKFCQDAVTKTVKELGRLTTLVNNAAVQVAKPLVDTRLKTCWAMAAWREFFRLPMPKQASLLL